MKSSAPEKDKNAAANAPEVLGRTVQPHDQAQPTTKAGTASCIGSDPTEIPSSIDAKIPQTTDTQSPTPMSNVNADLQRVESAPTDWSESTVGPKH
jgi:hypothetical protein